MGPDIATSCSGASAAAMHAGCHPFTELPADGHRIESVGLWDLAILKRASAIVSHEGRFVAKPVGDESRERPCTHTVWYDDL